MAWQDLGSVYYSTQRFPEAEAAFRQAILLNPVAARAHFSLACLLLRREAWAEGWPEFQWRLHCEGSIPRRPLGLPLWDGQQPHGKRILVANEDGFGDTFQFLRFLEPLYQAGARVYFWSTDEQKALFQRLPFFEQVATYTDELPSADSFSAYVTPLSLPYLLGASKMPFPHQPYFSWDHQKALNYVHRLGLRRERLRLGLLWASNRDVSSKQDRQRSLKLADMAVLFEDTSIRWISVQHGPAQKELWQVPWAIEDWGSELDSFDDTAALFAALDGVITIDSGPAHLAGALGVQTLCLLHRAACWRWGAHESHSTWYPSMTLMRQHDDGPWSDVMQRTLAAIARWQPTSLIEKW